MKGVEENRELFPEINVPAGSPEVKNAVFSFDEKGFFAPREEDPEKDVSDGG